MTPRKQPTLYEVAHEALIRNWDRLRQWIDADRAGFRMHQQLTEAYREWQEHDRDESYLYVGGRLDVAREWSEAHAPDLNPLEREFLDASLALRRRRKPPTRVDSLRSPYRSRIRGGIWHILLAAEALKAEPTFEARSSLLKVLPTLHGIWLEFTASLHTCGNVIGVAFSPDGTTLATSSDSSRGPTGYGGSEVECGTWPRGTDWSRSPWPCSRVRLGGWPSAPMARPWPRGTWAAPGAAGWCCGTWPAQRLVEEPLAVLEGGVRGWPSAPMARPWPRGTWRRRERRGGAVGRGRARLVEEPLAVLEGGVGGVAFSPDGKALAAGYMGAAWSGGVVLWDVAGETGEEP